MTKIENILKNHSIEIWNGYAVEIYTRNGVVGESFTSLSEFANVSDVRNWLGY